MNKLYINEPLVQELDLFTRFMGGMTGFIRSWNSLKKLTNEPKHWKGTKIDVTKVSNTYQLDNSKSYDRNGTVHLSYHSRFNPDHYTKCEPCRMDNDNFNNEPEFDEGNCE